VAECAQSTNGVTTRRDGFSEACFGIQAKSQNSYRRRKLARLKEYRTLSFDLNELGGAQWLDYGYQFYSACG
jgi:hypothetical protein